MTRQVSLNNWKQGISRLRTKGSPDAEALYDLLNGFINIAGEVESRPGTRQHAAIETGTKGLCVFESKFYVFSDSAKEVPSGYVCEILTHPTDRTATLVAIHFAKPYMGFLYVAAEWSTGETFHYWLQTATAWQANHVYIEGELVQPTVPNGFTYRANRLHPAAPAWAPNVAREVGDRVEPTTPNGYEYTVIEVLGANPRSGATEPDWNTGAGSITYEDADNTPPSTTTPGGGGGPVLPPGVGDRYDNPGGSKPNGIRTQAR